MSEGDASQSSVPPRQGVQAAIDHMLEKKIDALLWLTRIGTMIFTILSMIPLFGVNPYTSYQRALMSNAATSALRLHQRMPRVQLTREFGVMLVMEDSCHYLFYSILFILSYPLTLSLLPIFLFAFLHSVSYSLGILGKLGYHNSSLFIILGRVQCHMGNILRLIAFTEVCLMPLCVLLLFSGKGSLLTPFGYYRFLTFRYSSQRNPYTRNIFHEMRTLLESFANRPGQNITLRNLCLKVISFTSYLAPRISAAQQ